MCSQIASLCHACEAINLCNCHSRLLHHIFPSSNPIWSCIYINDCYMSVCACKPSDFSPRTTPNLSKPVRFTSILPLPSPNSVTHLVSDLHSVTDLAILRPSSQTINTDPSGSPELSSFHHPHHYHTHKHKLQQLQASKLLHNLLQSKTFFTHSSKQIQTQTKNHQHGFIHHCPQRPGCCHCPPCHCLGPSPDC